jgi:phosphoglycerol transferase MdoB-like AlkP superfamily enzyme
VSTQAQVSNKRMNTSLTTGANIVALAGAGFVVYGLMFIIRNFNGFIELGLTPTAVGATPDEIMSFSENLYHYISHLQVALAGFIIALGLVVIGLAIFGIRRGESWALWTAFLAPVVALAIALPLHYPYHFATFGHLGLSYLDAVILLIGTILSYRAMKA